MTDCGITCGACQLAGLCGDPIPPARPLSADVARHAADVTALAEARWVDLVGEPLPEPKRELCGSCDAGLPMTCTCAAIDAYLDEALDPDAPDVDPAEPKPEGAGCCGGSCLLR